MWSFPNPLRDAGKELCDILVVSDPDIIIVSVKEIEYRDNKPEPVASAKWQRKAVIESVGQIYKAEKWIVGNRPVQTREKNPIVLPDLKRRKIHRIAVALGSKGKTLILSEDFGRGYVHVHDELSIHALTRELDTITDFVEYLNAVESFVQRNIVILESGEENLLASYLYNGRSFPTDLTPVVIPDGNWSNFESRPEVKLRRIEDQISYHWDDIIETFSNNLHAGTLDYPATPDETEVILRTMARENRYNRRLLAKQFDDVLQNTPKTQGRARMFQSPSGIGYVLLISPRNVSRAERREQLAARCFVARNLLRSSSTIIGLATEHLNPKNRSGFIDACYLHYPDWTDDLRKKAELTQQTLGYFASPARSYTHLDEYPPVKGEDGEAKSQVNPDTAKFEFLREKYPLTYERVMKSPEFNVLGNQLGLEGYKSWQILGAACSVVMNYRIDYEEKISRSDTDRVMKYVDRYVETPYSLFPSLEKLTLKEARNRIRAQLAPVALPNNLLNPRQEDPGNVGDPNGDPENCLYVKTMDDFHLWFVYFPDYQTRPGEISISNKWKLKVGCDCKDTTSYRFSKELARDVAKYAGVIDFLVEGIESSRKKELAISVIDEGIMKERFHDSYVKALKGRAEIGSEAMILAWRDLKDEPHVKLGINEEISQQPRMKRLAYAVAGILQCISGLSQDRSLQLASEFVSSLE